MSFFLLIPVILSFLLLGAHFFRNFGPMGLISLIPLVLLFIRRSWVPLIMQALLLIGALEYLRYMLGRIEERQADGDPWVRMAIILASASLFIALSALSFETPPLRRRYARRRFKAVSE